MPAPFPLVRWQFYDPTGGGSTYTFDLNPKEGGSPATRRNVTSTPVTAPDGKTLVFVSSDLPKQLEWSGPILEQDHFEALEEWADKNRQIRLTDDLGREFWIVITEFVPTRKPTLHHPWRHDYRAVAITVDWA